MTNVRREWIHAYGADHHGGALQRDLGRVLKVVKRQENASAKIKKTRERKKLLEEAFKDSLRRVLLLCGGCFARYFMVHRFLPWPPVVLCLVVR